MQHNYSPQFIRKFWMKVDVRGEDVCWNWKHCKNKSGYGRGHIPGQGHCYAHRIAYEITYGTVPDALRVLHTYDNPSCCNPKHLFLGTLKDNMADMKRKGRQRYTGRPKIVPDTVVAEVRRRYAEGNVGEWTLAKEYGISPSYIHELVNYESRKPLA